MEPPRLDPSRYRVLLVGPRVVHLKPFLEQRRYQVTAQPDGLDGMTALSAAKHDVVLLELHLGDLTAAEFLMSARQTNPQATFLLLDDPSKAGQIVRTLQAGLDGYVPTPPDEERLFFEVERHLLRRTTAREDSTSSAPRFSDVHSALGHANERVVDAEARILDLLGAGDALRAELEAARAAGHDERASGAEVPLTSVADGDVFDADQLAHDKHDAHLALELREEVSGLREELALAVEIRHDLGLEIDGLREQLASALSAVPQSALHESSDPLEAEHTALEARLRDEENARRILEDRLRELEPDAGALTGQTAAQAGSEFDQEAGSTDQEGAAGALSSEVERLRREQAIELQQLQAESAQQDAALRQLRVDATRALEKVRLEKDAALERARVEKEAALEHSIDLQLQLDELREKGAERHELELRYDERLKAADASHRQERLRLVEEKEASVADSQRAAAELERRRQDVESLRRQVVELEARVGEADERFRAVDARARVISDEGRSLAAFEGDLRAQVKTLQQVAAHSRSTVQELESRLRLGEDELRQAREDALAAVNSTASRLFELEHRHRETEAELTELQRSAREVDAQRAEATRRLRETETELGKSRRRITELADAVKHASSTPPPALIEERDRLRARLVEAEQWIAQAQPHVEALRADRERLTAQAMTFNTEAQRRAREAEDARSQVTLLRAQLEALAGRQLALEQERDRLQAGGSVLEATEPLRWGLTAALEYLGTFESKAPQLSVHLRHLRLLESTLTKLAGGVS